MKKYLEFLSFKPCEENVQKPTLIRKDQNGIQVWLQWFGEAKEVDLTGKQFLFPIDTKIDQFFFQPESFEIIMIGPVKNWPEKEYIDYLAQKIGGENQIIFYFISSKFGVDDGAGRTIPAAFVLPNTITLLDQNYGVIEPKEFFDDSIRLEAIRKIQSD